MNAPLAAPEKPQLRTSDEPIHVGSGPDVVETARSLRRSGLSYRQIAYRLGANRGNVYQWCNPDREAVYKERRARQQALSPEMRAWIARRKREIAGEPLTQADKEQLARAMDDVGGA